MRTAFLSSVVGGFESFRQAAAEGCRSAGYQPVMCESFGARPYSSEIACITEVEQSEVYILILGARYGYQPRPGLSVTQQEFEAAISTRKPVLAFIQKIDMEPEQDRFRQQVEQYSAGFFRETFATEIDLERAIVRGLLQLGQARNSLPESDFVQRVESGQRTLEWDHQQQSPQWAFASLPQPMRKVSIPETEVAYDDWFVRLSRAGLVTLRRGFEVREGPSWVALESHGFSHAIFDDGLQLLTANPSAKERRDFAFSMAFHFVSPSRVLQLTQGASQVVAVTGGWFQVELSGMDSRIFEEPPERSHSIQIPHRHTNDHQVRELLIPADAVRLATWSSAAVGIFRRAFRPMSG